MSTRDDDAYHKPRQAVQLETVRLGGVVGRHDFVRSTNVAFLIGNLAWLLAQMSFDHSSKSKHWLERAAEVRTIAASMAEDRIKASTLRLASQLDGRPVEMTEVGMPAPFPSLDEFGRCVICVRRGFFKPNP